MKLLTNILEADQYLFLKFKLKNYRISIIIQDKISDIGKIKTRTREFNLNADRKRFWLGRIESMENKIVNESMPFSLNFYHDD